jgi:hypothetical protein
MEFERIKETRRCTFEIQKGKYKRQMEYKTFKELKIILITIEKI